MATPRLKEKYLKEIVPGLKDKFQYKSVMQVPKVEKICINKGIGAAVADKKLIDVGVEELTTISGRKPWLHAPRKTFPISNSATIRRLAPELPYVAIACMNSWTD